MSLDGLNLRDFKRIEQRNKILMGNVRDNINKIDKIVKKIANFSRDAQRHSSVTVPLHVNNPAKKNQTFTEPDRERTEETCELHRQKNRESKTGKAVRTLTTKGTPLLSKSIHAVSNVDLQSLRSSVQGFMLGKSVRPIPIYSLSKTTQSTAARVRQKHISKLNLKLPNQVMVAQSLSAQTEKAIFESVS